MARDLLEANKEEYLFEDVAYKPKCAVAMIDESPKLRVVIPPPSDLAHPGIPRRPAGRQAGRHARRKGGRQGSREGRERLAY
eukprot:353362-Rhodomonas_salina.1